MVALSLALNRPSSNSTGFRSTPSPFLPPLTSPSSHPPVRPIPLPYPPLKEHHHEKAVSSPPAAVSDGPSSATAERRLAAFFKLAHSRILVDGKSSDIRAISAALFPVYLQLCAHMGEEGDCNALVGELFKARYNEMQIELDRMDRLHLVLLRLMRARGRLGKKKKLPGGGTGGGTRSVLRRVRKSGRWILG